MSHIVENYLTELYLMEDMQYISEDLASALNKLKPENLKKIAKDLKSKFKAGPEKLMKTIDKIKAPTVHVDKITRAGKKMSSDFRDDYVLAKRVLDNSFPNDVSDDVKKAAATFLAVQGSLKEVDYKNMLSKFVQVVRYFANAAKNRLKEVPESTMFEAVIGWIAIISITMFVITMVFFPVVHVGPLWVRLLFLLIIYLALVVRRTEVWQKFKKEFNYMTYKDVVNRGGGSFAKPVYSNQPQLTGGSGPPTLF